MTSLKGTLKSDLTAAMKAGDNMLKSTLRMAIAAVMNAEVAGSEAVELSDDQVLKILQAETKKRLESAEIYQQAGRTESAAQESAEAEILSRYLPAAMSDDELLVIVNEEVATAVAAGNEGAKAMGLVVKAVRARAGSSADGAKIAAQLHHGGLVAGYSSRWGHPLWAPCIPPAPTGNFMKYFLPEELAAFSGITMPEIKVLTPEDIATVVRQFAEGAARAQKAGFDAVEIHSGHGYLLSSFISPKTNSRTDEYGGPIENRLRILREVLAAVRAAVGKDYPVWVKLDSREVGKTDGISLEDAKFAARTVEDAGADAITVSAYHDTGNGKLHSESNIPHVENFNLPAAAEMKAELEALVQAGRSRPE